MSRWILRLALIAGIAALAYYAVRALFPGPAEVIRQRLEKIAELASTAGNESMLAGMNKAQRLTSYFTPTADISIEIPGQLEQTITGTDELLRIAMAARSMGRTLKVELVDITVTVEPGAQSAEAHLTGKATLGGDRSFQAQELKAHFKKVDGQWLIDHAETVRTLR